MCNKLLVPYTYTSQHRPYLDQAIFLGCYSFAGKLRLPSWSKLRPLKTRDSDIRHVFAHFRVLNLNCPGYRLLVFPTTYISRALLLY